MEPEVIRWYTRARKFPQLIGRTHDGSRIPGGPYTYTQFIGGFIVLYVGVNTMGLWGGFGFFTNLALLIAGTAATVWLLGRIPVGARNPISVVAGFVRALPRPQMGSGGGRQPPVPKPHRLHHKMIIAAVALPARSISRPIAPTPAAQPPSGAPPDRAAPLTGVQSLLAASRRTSRSLS